MTRERLSNRRSNETIEFRHSLAESSMRYVATLGRFPDGELAEVFLNAGKIDASADVNARDGAVAISLALQYGCPASTLRHAMARKPDGTALGPLGALLDLAERNQT